MELTGNIEKNKEINGKMSQIVIPMGSGSTANIYIQDEEPIDAPDGSIWIDTNEILPPSNIPDWAKQPNKPTYTAKEVGAATPEYVNEAIANLPIGGEDKPMKLLYDKTFENVNSIDDVCEELKDYKKIFWELKAFDRTEKIPIYYIDFFGLHCMYGGSLNCSTSYPWAYATGELEWFGDFLQRKSYVGSVAQRPDYVGGMSGSLAYYSPVQVINPTNAISFAFLGTDTANVQLKIWGC